MRFPLFAMARAFILVCACAGSALGQWNPQQGQWGKSDSRDVRVMAYNIEDGICRTQPKVEGLNSWCALARIVATLKPDVLIIEEAGDNSGNGTGAGVDSVSQLTTVLGYFLHGGTDSFLGGAVTSYVQKYAPAYDLPYIYVSDQSDNFNRNCVLSRFPFADLNGDTKPVVSQIIVSADLYAPGGTGGIRGFGFAEINLPDASYRGDMVMGFAHLRCCGESSDLAERLAAAKNVAYYIDYLFNGGGTNTPDPRNRVLDSPPVTSVLGPYTPVLIGGDWNEDENSNGRDGPAWWMTKAANGAGDGTDKDRSDSTYDDARDPFTNSRGTFGNSSKLDYLAWQDSIATLRRAVIFNSANIPSNAYPPELIGFVGSPAVVSSAASDHRTLFIDLILPAPAAPGAFALASPADGAAELALTPTLGWTASTGADTYTVKIADNAALASPLFVQNGVVATSLAVPAGVLDPCSPYFWGVTAVNGSGSTESTPVAFSFGTYHPSDFDGDGFITGTDYDLFVQAFELGEESADFDGDGFISGTDFDLYVQAFESGC